MEKLRNVVLRRHKCVHNPHCPVELSCHPISKSKILLSIEDGWPTATDKCYSQKSQKGNNRRAEIALNETFKAECVDACVCSRTVRQYDHCFNVGESKGVCRRSSIST